MRERDILVNEEADILKINATLTQKTGNWSSISRHVHRQVIHDSNEKSINKKLTHYNRSSCEANVDKLLRQHYEPYIEKRNRKNIKQGRRHRVQTFDDYKKGKKLTCLGIATFGTLKDKKLCLDLINKSYPNLSSGQVKDRYFKAMSWAFRRYAKHWNGRNKYIKMGHAVSNTDEQGSAHLHFEIIPLGFTKAGKPSGNLKWAIERQYHTKDRHEAFKKWNKQETTEIVKTVGTVLGQRFSKVPQFQQWTLHHTGRKYSISMEAFKQSKDYYNKKQQQLADEKRDFEIKKQREINFEADDAKRRLLLDEDLKKRARLQAQRERAWKKAQSKRITKARNAVKKVVKDDKEERLKNVDVAVKRHVSKVTNDYGKLLQRNTNLKANNKRLTDENSSLKKINDKLKSTFKALKSGINDILKRGKNYFNHVKNNVKSDVKNITKAFNKATKAHQQNGKPVPKGYKTIKQARKDRERALRNREDGKEKGPTK